MWDLKTNLLMLANPLAADVVASFISHSIFLIIKIASCSFLLSFCNTIFRMSLSPVYFRIHPLKTCRRRNISITRNIILFFPHFPITELHLISFPLSSTTRRVTGSACLPFPPFLLSQHLVLIYKVLYLHIFLYLI